VKCRPTVIIEDSSTKAVGDTRGYEKIAGNSLLR
jgi:hypothetical protein